MASQTESERILKMDLSSENGKPEVIEQFKHDHRGWKASSFEDEMLNTQDLAREATRLENALTDIGWGGERDNQFDTWEQIRHDLSLKEQEVRDLANKNSFQEKN